jgi:hypothetical protein
VQASLFTFSLTAVMVGLFLWRRNSCKHHRKHRTQKRRTLSFFIALVIVAMSGAAPRTASSAGATVPSTQIYNGHLLTQDDSPVTTAVSIRFSEWNSAAVAADDVINGVINTQAATYLQWNETHTVTPNDNGYFSVELGGITPLPDYGSMPSGTSVFLQIEVKAESAAVTSYELLDIAPGNPLLDRSAVASVPFASNANALQGHQPGTGSGSLPVLGSGGLLSPSLISGATNVDFFTVDAEDSASDSLGLRFGTSLAKTLSYDIVRQLFRFNDSVEIQGDLTVTGLINGVKLSDADTPLKLTASGGLNVAVTPGNYRINDTTSAFSGSGNVALTDNATTFVFFSSGGLATSTTAFPMQASNIPLAEVTTENGNVKTVTDRRVLLSDDREETLELTLHPQYEGAAFQGDGQENVGQMTLSYDNIHLKNFYVWTSTRPALQDYDILVRVTLPSTFKRWNGGIRLQYRSTSADSADNTLAVQLYDTNGTPVTLTDATDLAATTWTETDMRMGGSPVWTPGQECMIRLHLSARNDNQMQLGDLKLQFDTVR